MLVVSRVSFTFAFTIDFLFPLSLTFKPGKLCHGRGAAATAVVGELDFMFCSSLKISELQLLKSLIVDRTGDRQCDILLIYYPPSIPYFSERVDIC